MYFTWSGSLVGTRSFCDMGDENYRHRYDLLNKNIWNQWVKSGWGGKKFPLTGKVTLIQDASDIGSGDYAWVLAYIR